MQTDYGSSSISQFALTEWLSSGASETYIKRIRTELQFRRDFTIRILNKYFKDLAAWNEPKGGFYIWLSIHKQISSRKLFKKALNEGILLHPGNIYDRDDQQHLRLSYSYAPLQQLEQGLIRLSQLIKELS